MDGAEKKVRHSSTSPQSLSRSAVVENHSIPRAEAFFASRDAFTTDCKSRKTNGHVSAKRQVTLFLVSLVDSLSAGLASKLDRSDLQPRLPSAKHTS